MKVSIALFVFLALSTFTSAKVLVQIDEFNENIQPVFVIVTNGNADPDEYLWYSPYPDYVSVYTGLMNWAGDPEFSFSVTDKALGGHRDLVLGHQTDSPSNSIASLTIVGEAASLAFPLLYAGGCYVQWDGDDTGGDSTQAFPGVTLNTVPGIGQGEAIGKANGAVDFTFGGRALGLTITIVTDHTVNYFMDAVDSAGNFVSISFLAQATSARERYFFRFTDPDWETLDGSQFDFTDVAGFQVRIFTFSDGAGGTTEQAVDTEFSFIQILGYEVSGRVLIDCLCDGIDLDPVFGEQVDIFVRNAPTALASQTTDANGFYNFDVATLTDGSYTVCINDRAAQRCPASSACVDIVLQNFEDVTDINFILTTTTQLVLPPDEDFPCGNCIDPFNNADPNCPEPATATGCDGVNTPLTTFTDSSTFSNNGCVQTIRRTWRDPDTGQSGVQTITLTDNEAPILLTSAQSRTLSCEDPTSYNDWIQTRAGATADDCTGFTWSASANSQPIRCDSETVTFTATDPCGFSVQTTATYTVIDNIAPQFSPNPSDETAECNLKTGSSTTTFNSWRSSRGRSSVTDNCASSGQLIVTDDFTAFPPFSNCQQSTTVTFTASDGCGNVAIQTASFTIIDSSPPTINPESRNSQATCSTSGNDNNAFQAWLADNGGARASDLCIANDANLVWTNNFNGGNVGGSGTCNNPIPVTFTVQDSCGQTASTTSTFTIQDNTAPTITTQASNDSAQCDGSGSVPEFNDWVANRGGATAVDSCSTVTSSDNAGGPPTNCGDSQTVTFSFSDVCGNGPVSTTASFTLVDSVPPTFSPAPSDSSAECSPTASSQFDSWLASNAFSGAVDNCSNTGIVITNDFTGNTLSSGCLNTATVRFFARDACGNTSPASTATFTISDNTDPTITVPAASQQVECNLGTNQNDYRTFVNSRGGAEATDSCGMISWTNNAPANFQAGCTVGQEVTFTANDGCGNTAVTTASFSVNDSTAPTIVNQANDLTVECNGNGNTNDLNNWLGNRGGATATDNCSQVEWTNDFTALSGGCVSTATVTFTACDICNLCTSTQATFTINDSSSPVISPRASQRTVECDPGSNSNAFTEWVNDNGGARATDLCEDDADLIWSSTFQASPAGCDSEEVTFTVSDLCGRTASTTAVFTIIDTVVPQITTPPQDVSVECDGTGNVDEYNNFVNSRAGAVATDVCAFSLVWTNNAPAAGPVGCGNQIVTFTVEDECLNSNTVTATFRVQDTNGPAINTPAADRTVECAGSNENLAAVQAWLDENGTASAFDSCYNTNFAWTNNFTGLSFDGCESSAEVTFRATDPCGQASSTTATFRVVDTRPPTITQTASSEIFECDDNLNPGQIQNFVNNRGGATATDSCSSVFWSNDFSTGPTECGPALSITFTATDGCGNFAVTVGSVSIDDTVAPNFVNFPADIALGCDQEIDPDTAGRPNVFDACDADITPSFTDVSFKEPDEGFCPGDLVTIRTWSIVDDCGNFFSQDQVVTTIFARATGPCEPTQCPPCELTECCEQVTDRVACNPVSCNAVACMPTPCDAVPCIPNGGCQVDPPFYFDDDDVIGPAPVIPVAPLACEPVYIYVFDDDDTNQGGGDNDPVLIESSSSASVTLFSGFLLMLVLSIFI